MCDSKTARGCFFSTGGEIARWPGEDCGHDKALEGWSRLPAALSFPERKR